MYYPFALSHELEDVIMAADYVLSVGGDKYSLDYLPPVALLTVDRYAMSQGQRVVLWGASVGPFNRNPAMEKWFVRHLEGMSLIAVRESLTRSYLESLGLGARVIETVDSAFMLEPQPVDLGGFWPLHTGEGVVGLNLSPIVIARHDTEASKGRLLDSVKDLVHYLVEESDLSIVLVPHVASRSGDTLEDDVSVLRSILDDLARFGGRISMMPQNLNAAQTKYVISKCRYFIGARTHSTIASISSNVPTLSIGYSVKANGINQGIFGHTDFVVNCTDVTDTDLVGKFRVIEERETELRSYLRGSDRKLRSKAMDAVRRLRELS